MVIANIRIVLNVLLKGKVNQKYVMVSKLVNSLKFLGLLQHAQLHNLDMASFLDLIVILVTVAIQLNSKLKETLANV